MSVRYDINYQDVEELEQKFERIPGNIENIINSYLHKEGADKTIKHITHLMPVSNRDTPRHAKYSKWAKVEPHNLGFTVKPRGGAANNPRSFGYLVFPNEGRGPHNDEAQHFMERGLHNSINDIMQGLNEHVDRYLEEEF